MGGLNLTPEDVAAGVRSQGESLDRSGWFYPIEMVRAIAIVWLFAGLRSDEIRRLRVGAVRWQREDVRVSGSDDVLPKDVVCFLSVPVNKTSPAFTKPVDRPVGEAIMAWEAIRPFQPRVPDRKTGELVDFLFTYRGRLIGSSYLNLALNAAKPACLSTMHEETSPATAHARRSRLCSPTPRSRLGYST